MKVIVVYSGKGGSGKTPICRELAYRFARAGKRVLVLDLSVQYQTTTGLGALPSNKLYDFVVAKAGVDACEFIEHTRINGLDILTSGNMAGDAHRIAFATQKPRNFLASTLSKMADYDLVVIDTDQGGLFADMAVAAADMIVSPIFMTGVQLDALMLTPGYVKEVRDSVGREYPATVAIPIMNRSKRKEGFLVDLTEAVANSAEVDGSPLAAWTVYAPIAETAQMDSATSNGKTLAEYRPKHKTSIAIDALAADIIDLFASE